MKTNKDKIVNALNAVIAKYVRKKVFFKKKPTISFSDDGGCITLDFEMKNFYSRSVHLGLFEEFVNGFVKDFQNQLKMRRIFNVEFWGAGACDMQFVRDMKHERDKIQSASQLE